MGDGKSSGGGDSAVHPQSEPPLFMVMGQKLLLSPTDDENGCFTIIAQMSVRIVCRAFPFNWPVL